MKAQQIVLNIMNGYILVDQWNESLLNIDYETLRRTFPLSICYTCSPTIVNSIKPWTDAKVLFSIIKSLLNSWSTFESHLFNNPHDGVNSIYCTFNPYKTWPNEFLTDRSGGLRKRINMKFCFPIIINRSH